MKSVRPEIISHSWLAAIRKSQSATTAAQRLEITHHRRGASPLRNRSSTKISDPKAIM